MLERLKRMCEKMELCVDCPFNQAGVRCSLRIKCLSKWDTDFIKQKLEEWEKAQGIEPQQKLFDISDECRKLFNEADAYSCMAGHYADKSGCSKRAEKYAVKASSKKSKAWALVHCENPEIPLDAALGLIGTKVFIKK